MYKQDSKIASYGVHGHSVCGLASSVCMYDQRREREREKKENGKPASKQVYTYTHGDGDSAIAHKWCLSPAFEKSFYTHTYKLAPSKLPGHGKISSVWCYLCSIVSVSNSIWRAHISTTYTYDKTGPAKHILRAHGRL